MPVLPNPRLAPVSYPEVARGFQLARAVGAGLLVIAGLALTVGEPNIASSDLVLAAGVVTVHAIYRLRHPADSPFATILMDTTLAGATILLVGQPDLASGAALVYVLAATTLLLPPIRAVVVLALAAVFTVSIILFAPVSRGAVEVGASLTFSTATSTALLIGTAILIVSTGLSMLGSRSRHESALETEREAVRLKNEFVSMVSHELRTPLTSIAGFTETLAESWRNLGPNEVDEFISIVRTEARNLSHLVEDILVIPRIEAGRLPLDVSVFELRALCMTVTEVLSADTDKDLEVAMPAGIMVKADPMRLQQVIRNLVVNAIKYGGDQILIQGMPQGESLQAVVSDNGPGIPDEDRGRIFEHFEQGSIGDTRESSGVGLGLPIARKLIRAMGGDLWFEPRFPTGSNFFFTVRITEKAREEPSLLQG